MRLVLTSILVSIILFKCLGWEGRETETETEAPVSPEQDHFPFANPTAQRGNSNNSQSGILGSLSVLHTLLAQRGLKAAQADCSVSLHCAFLQPNVRARYEIYGLADF